MKPLFTLSAILLCLALSAQPPKDPARKGDHYGTRPEESNVQPAATLLKVFGTPDTVPFKVRARVEEVCAKKGCWLTLRVNDSTTAFVKMKDYAFFVPVDLSGKEVIIEGRSFLDITSVEELRHYAKDAKKSQKEIESITVPKKEVRIIASGILVTS